MSTDPLVDEGWRWPAHAGPRPRTVVIVAAIGVLVLVTWAIVGTGWLAERNQQPHRIVVHVKEDGSVTLDGHALRTHPYHRGDVHFLVARGRVPSDHPVKVHVTGMSDRVIVRTMRPLDTDERTVVLVEVPSTVLSDHEHALAGKPLRTITDPLDAQIRHVREQRHAIDRIQSNAWWIALVAFVASVLIPLLLWRRAARRFLSMRRPGPGVEPGVEPPSTLDPVGAALLVAGTGTIDTGAAFAGHVLDLVERRQLPMRRSTTTPPGAGTLLGLHHADEVEDVAVALLSKLVTQDESSLLLPDARRAVMPHMDDAGRATWRGHIATRAAFERMLVPAATQRIGALTAALSIMLVASLAWSLIAGPSAARTMSLLVAASTLSAGIVLVAWLRDALRWRVVARSRRVERAQWLAWRDSAMRSEAASADQRNLPVLVAIGASPEALRAHVSADAVDLAAVSTRTVEVLCGIAR